jgi:signal transduction histidine kinase/uncharacterized pyridoxamine 5'-phosphate oxidase family protein
MITLNSILPFVFICLIVFLIAFAAPITWVRRQFEALHENTEKLLQINSLKELCEEAVKNFTDVFYFDYAVISLIDFEKRKITSEYSNEKIASKLGDASPKKWIHQSDYELHTKPKQRKDILLEVLEKNKQIKVFENKISDQKIPAEALNPNIQEVHKGINRVFLPISYIIKKKDSNNIQLGVIELGLKNKLRPISFSRLMMQARLWSVFNFYLAFFSIFFSQNSIKSIDDFYSFFRKYQKVIMLELYVSVFAQRYYLLLQKELERKAIKVIIEDDIKPLERIDDTNNYIQTALNRITAFTNSKYAILSFNTFNQSHIDFTNNTFYAGGISRKNIVPNFKNIDKSDSITRHTLESGTPYLTGDAPNDPYFQPCLDGIKEASIIAFPLRKEQIETPLGILLLISDEYDYYTGLHQAVITVILERVIRNYFRKKRYKAYQTLAYPAQLWTSPEEAYLSVSKILQEHYNSDKVSVWVRESKNEKEFTLSEKAMNPIFYQQFQQSFDNDEVLKIFSTIETKEIYQSEKHPIVEVLTAKKEGSRIATFLAKNEFKNYIHLRVIVLEKCEAFIDIFSKRKLEVDFIDNEKDFLTQIVNKLSMSIQGLKLLRSFTTISNALSQPKSDLGVIVQCALETTNADIVSYLPVKKGRILKSDAVNRGYEVKEEKYIVSNPYALTAENILKIDTVSKYFSNLGEYRKFLRKDCGLVIKNDQMPKSFLARNEIVSMAAIKVTHLDETLGVLFFNYRHSINFDNRQSLKSLIENFSSFLAVHLLKQDIMDDLQLKKEHLEKAVSILIQHQATVYKDLQRKKDEIEKLEKDFADILPRATRTSFYQILDGINHTVKSTLLTVGLELEDIKQLDTRTNVLNQKSKEIIYENLDKIGRLIIYSESLLNLFDFFKQDKERIIVFNVIKSIIDFFNIFNYDFIKIDTKDIDKSLFVVFNKAEFNMIIYNLINNAIQALLIKSSKVANFEGQIKITAVEKKNIISIHIRDNGVGIDKEIKQKIFDRGFTTKKNHTEAHLKGTGIGLYFVKEILKKEYHSQINCTSEVGKFTEFTIEIPTFINHQ